MRNRYSTRAMLGAAALTVLFAGSAFTAANTVDDHRAGIGSATVTGVQVDSISYQLSTDRTTVNSVTFTHAHDDLTEATKAEVQLTATGQWYDCGTVTASTDAETSDGQIVCVTTGEDFESADNLVLVVGDNLTQA